MRILIMGAGGLGSVIGGLLARTGVDVTLVARKRHVEAIRAHGLAIEGVRGSLLIRDHLEVCETPDETGGYYDYYVLGVKSKDVGDALKASDGLADRIGCCFSVQNNLKKEEHLAGAFGSERVIGFATAEGGKLLEPGRVLNTHTTPVTAFFGELDGSQSQRVKEISAAFNVAGLGAEAVDDIVSVQWGKLAMICIGAAWTSSTFGLLEAGYPDGWETRWGAEQYVQIGKEVCAVFRALDRTPLNLFGALSHLEELDGLSFPDAVSFMQQLAKRYRAETDRSISSSMHQDIRNGRTTEAEEIIRPFLDAAEEAGVPVPTLWGAYRVIKTVEILQARTNGETGV